MNSHASWLWFLTPTFRLLYQRVVGAAAPPESCVVQVDNLKPGLPS
jgi:hypothetical protein